MIYAEYVEYDMPNGERVHRLEAYGHAGYAPKGKDIVCAGVSTLMQTLVYQLANCRQAECSAYSEPTGPRISVKLQGAEHPAEWEALEFAKTGLALLAERYPANVRFEDKSRDGQDKMIELQLFADGGDGGADGSAAEGEGEGAAMELPKLRPAEERLARRSGVLKRSASAGRNAAAAETAAPDEGRAARENGDAAAKDSADPDDGEDAGAKDTDGSGEDGGEEKKTLTPEEHKRAFRELLQGEYKAEAEELMQKAVAMAAEKLEASPALKELMTVLAEKYGTDASDLAALTEAVKNGAVKDDAYYEKLAMEKGVSVKTARELDKLESQNKQLTAQQAMAQQLQRDAAQRAQIAQIQAQWDREAEALEKKYPGFDRAEVLANPEVAQMMQAGVSMENAYRAAYFDRLLEADRAETARQTEQGVVERIRQRGSRPGENGTRPGGAVQTRLDVAHMSRREMEALEKRVLRGEIITL